MAQAGETNLKEILKSLKPKHNEGDFVFCVAPDFSKINPEEILMTFREDEGNTILIKKELADSLQLQYSFVASWITLTVHSSLSAVGLTASISKALAGEGISCNMVAAFHHDHIFVDKKDTEAAMATLLNLQKTELEK
jgi:uncharacterized protein